MIIKSYEINKINIENQKFILFYGKNEGLKTEAIKYLIKNKSDIFYYEEQEIIDNSYIFMENIWSKSLFESEKIIIIKRASDKIFKIIDEIISKKIDDLIIIISTDNLDKKSKLRSFFEKTKECICVAFYPDNDQTLTKLAFGLLKEKKISLSSSNINLIISKCNGDRQNLINEIEKLENLNRSGRIIKSEDIKDLTNLNENYSISELIDNCLAKNLKKTIYILNENNFVNEDCVQIMRTFLNKSKRILYLSKNYEINENLEQTISSARPPIFWKDKEIIKQQLYKNSTKNIRNLIYKLNELEIIVKKNNSNALNITSDFLLNQAST
tara:strand:- start:82 stop:1062 length:981 start_codon:yes stop_codon:yes gene_type:complete